MWKVYVGNLDARIRERELAEEFGVYGLVRSVWVARRPPGYAFIEFDTCREVDNAVSALDGKHGWRVEPSRRSSGDHKSKPYSSESRCRECGSSRHSTKDCRPLHARGSHRRSSSPHSRTILNRCDFPRKRERSISPESVCIKISQNDEGNSPTNVCDAPRQDDPNIFSEGSHSRSPNDQKGSADECIVPRKRERKRSPEHYASKSPENNPDTDAELEGTAFPEHYPSSSQNDEDCSADECNVPRKRERKRSPEQYPSRSPQNDQDGSHADNYMEGKHECSRSPEHDLNLENYNDNSDVGANEKQDYNRSPEPEHNLSPQNNRDRSPADELSPAREDDSDSRSPLLESSPEY